MKKDRKLKVAVVTGASSGIGRATAHEFARRGYIVVCAARNRQALEEVVDECKGMGSQALAVVTDVSSEDEIKTLASTAFHKYGSLDVWVNNAAVSLFGRFEQVPMADIRKVIETNLFGYIYGAREALSYFREQGYGTLINVSSEVALKGQPYTGAYVATKAAIKALSESLQQELMDDTRINVCSVITGVTDTPIFQHAANYTGQQVVAPKPVHPPEMVAETIADLAKKPRKEVFAGAAGSMALTKALTPSGMYDRKVKKNIEQNHFLEVATDASQGNLYDSFMDQLYGGWMIPNEKKKSSRAWLQVGMVAAGFGLALAAFLGYRKYQMKSKKTTTLLVPMQQTLEARYRVV